jgi:hypothetical protein
MCGWNFSFFENQGKWTLPHPLRLKEKDGAFKKAAPWPALSDDPPWGILFLNGGLW